MQVADNMPRSDTWFKPGQSGNPAGRKPGRSGRDAIRAELAKPTVEDPRENGYEMWARKIVQAASDGDNAEKLEVLKFLEGVSPPTKAAPEESTPNRSTPMAIRWNREHASARQKSGSTMSPRSTQKAPRPPCWR